MSSSQALKTLLTIKRAAEESAAQLLTRQTARRAAAEANHLRLEAEARAARDDLRQRRAVGASDGPETAARALEREQFWGRLMDVADTRTARVRAYREGELAEAGAEVATALTAYRVAREARQVVDRLLEKAHAAERQAQARRDEVARDDQGQHPRWQK